MARYICKRCGETAPVGVGYVDNVNCDMSESEAMDRCACGWSVKSGTPTPPLKALPYGQPDILAPNDLEALILVSA